MDTGIPPSMEYGYNEYACGSTIASLDETEEFGWLDLLLGLFDCLCSGEWWEISCFVCC